MIQLIRNSLRFYWRTNLAVLAGIAVAVGVLAGALMTGESVRRSLLELAVGRLGKTDVAVTGMQPFREKLAQEIGGVPIITMEAIGQHQASGRRAAKVQVYGVDPRFWKFHGWSGDAPSARQVLLSEALAAELNAKDGDSILLRVEKPSEIPQETLHGKREESSRSMRFTYKGTAPEFALRPQQGAILAAYVPLARLQQELEVVGKSNTILLSGEANAREAVRSKFALEDLGLRLRQPDTPILLAIEFDGRNLGLRITREPFYFRRQPRRWWHRNLNAVKVQECIQFFLEDFYPPFQIPGAAPRTPTIEGAPNEVEEDDHHQDPNNPPRIHRIKIR